jgi:hypothetical protein
MALATPDGQTMCLGKFGKIEIAKGKARAVPPMREALRALPENF